MGQATGDKELRTVSIPLSEFCWLKHLQVGGEFEDLGVSIPLSEFCWLKQLRGSGRRRRWRGFNSPLGILLVEAG